MAGPWAPIEIGQVWEAIGAPQNWVSIDEPAGDPDGWVVRMAVGIERVMPSTMILDSYELVAAGER